MVYTVIQLQAPTYHIILEVLLVIWITYLLLFSKQYHPDRDRRPNKEVKVYGRGQQDVLYDFLL